MKIVQTLWSLPAMSKEDGILENRLKGGWLQSKYYYYSIAYSCLTLRKFYDSVELVGDNFAIDLLIDKLSLPYTSVKKLPDWFDTLPVGLWALPKVYTYSIQDEPFLHVDNDIFIWKRFSSKLEYAPLIVQNYEKLTPDYELALNIITDKFKYRPPFLQTDYDKKKDQSINAGIFGGNDLEFIRFYTSEVFNFIDKNMQSIKENIKYTGTLNVVFEQMFFYQLARLQNKDIKTLYKRDFFENMANLRKFEQVPFNCTYIHCLGLFKKNPDLCEQIEFRLCSEYNDYYHKIIKLLNVESIENSSKYINFKKTNSVIANCKAKDMILDIPLRLNSGLEISEKANEYYLFQEEENLKLEHWNKLLLYFYDSTITGRKLFEMIRKSELNNHFTEKHIKDNLIGVISYHIVITQYLKISEY